MDKVTGSDPVDGGSIPSGRTIFYYINPLLNKYLLFAK